MFEKSIQEIQTIVPNLISEKLVPVDSKFVMIYSQLEELSDRLATGGGPLVKVDPDQV